jgi:hypothetical protein
MTKLVRGKNTVIHSFSDNFVILLTALFNDHFVGERGGGVKIRRNAIL